MRKIIETPAVYYEIKESEIIKDRYYIYMISKLTYTYRGDAMLENIKSIEDINIEVINKLNFEL
jgi:hypothetical protein